jgi:hypothetical protein
MLTNATTPATVLSHVAKTYAPCGSDGDGGLRLNNNEIHELAKKLFMKYADGRFDIILTVSLIEAIISDVKEKVNGQGTEQVDDD